VAKKLLTTPKGVAVYPHLSKPDTKFNKNGVYTVKLRLEGAEALAFAKQISAVAKAKVEELRAEKGAKKVKAADLPISKETDKDGAETGALVFSFKMNATGKNKAGEVFTRQPAIFNAQGVPDKTMRIGGGSTIRVSYELVPYDRVSTETKGMFLAGASLRLYAVQVIELVEFGGNAEYFGFESEEIEEESAPATAAAKGAADEDEEPVVGGSADEF
jgi:hypothetical protein